MDNYCNCFKKGRSWYWGISFRKSWNFFNVGGLNLQAKQICWLRLCICQINVFILHFYLNITASKLGQASKQNFIPVDAIRPPKLNFQQNCWLWSLNYLTYKVIISVQLFFFLWKDLMAIGKHHFYQIFCDSVCLRVTFRV